MHKLYVLICILIIPISGITQKKSIEYQQCIGITNQIVDVGSELQEDCTVLPESTIDSNKVVSIVQVVYCDSQPTNYLEVYFGGKNYFIDKSTLLIDEKNNAALENNDKLNLVDIRFNAVSYPLSLENPDFTDEELIQIVDERIKIQAQKDLIKFNNKCSSLGLMISNYYVYDESDYTEGTSFSVQVYNPTAKTIKYIWLDIVGYDAVDEKVIEKGASKKSVKCIGPIEPEGFSTYQFDYVWFTDIVDYSKIGTIKVQYMDKSIKTILKGQSVVLTDDLRLALKTD